MSNSSELITLRGMVRNLPLVTDKFRNGAMSKNDYLSHLHMVINRVRLWIGTEDSPEIFREVADELEAATQNRLAVVKRYQNSTCFQGGDFDLYLSCQNPCDFTPNQSGWGVL